MHITILSVEKDHVLFSTQHGIGSGKWVGSMPNEQENYYVELELEDKFCFGKNYYNTVNTLSEIICYGEKVLLIGMLESIDEDGYAVLRMDDAIIPFEIETKDLLAIAIGNFIKLEVEKLLIYPIEY